MRVFVGDFSGWQQRNIFFNELLRGLRPILQFSSAELDFERAIGRVRWRHVFGNQFVFRGGDFAVNFREAERVGFVYILFFRRILVAGQPTGVRLQRNWRCREKTVAVKGRVLMGRQDKIWIVLMPKLLVGFVCVVAEPDFLVRHAIGIEFGNNQRGVRFGFQRNVGGGLVEPLFPEQSVELPVAQVVGADEKEPALRGGVKQFPQTAGQLVVVQLSRRQRRVTVARKNLTRRSSRTIFRRIEDGRCVVGHEEMITKL